MIRKDGKFGGEVYAPSKKGHLKNKSMENRNSLRSPVQKRFGRKIGKGVVPSPREN